MTADATHRRQKDAAKPPKHDLIRMIDLVAEGGGMNRARYHLGLIRRAQNYDARIRIWLAMRATSRKKNRKFCNALHRVTEAILLILGRF